MINWEYVTFTDQSFPLTPNPSPKKRERGARLRFPFSQSWEKGLGDEGLQR